MKNILHSCSVSAAVLLSLLLLNATPLRAGDQNLPFGPMTALQARVKALEDRIVELNTLIKTLDRRVLELEGAMLKRRLDAPDKLHFYRECDAVLDRLEGETGRSEVVPVNFVPGRPAEVSIPIDPIEPTPTPPPSPRPVKIVLPLPESEIELRVLCNAVDNLPIGTDPRVQELSVATLQQSGDHGLAVLVAHGLYHDSPLIRARSAELLGTFGGQRVLRELIEAFYASAAPTVPPYQREYVKMLRDQISSITNKDFYFYIRRTARAPEIAAEMVNWWDQHWQTITPQLGEPELDQTSPYYFEELRTLRTLTLVKRDFSNNTNYPASVGVPPGEVTRDADQPFNATIPLIPRDLINRGSPPEERDAKALREANSRQRDRIP